MNRVWIILFAPLVAAAVIPLLPRAARAWSAVLAIGAVALSGVLTLSLAPLVAAGVAVSPEPLVWLDLPGLVVSMGAGVDRLGFLMLLVVTGVGTAVHVFSVGYMRKDPGYARYFSCLALFTFAMLGVVLAVNFIQVYLFWELVGLSSYLLIGFWFERPAAADAAKKALLTNRVGDFGLLIGILLVASLTHSLDFAAVQAAWPPAGVSVAVATLAGLLIFCGAVGKSAQFPLHVWLPDAMEGPTPVSALIHAATMVAAGVYLMARLAWLLTPFPVVGETIAWVGGITALMAAAIAVVQTDIKRVLAYSTLSQLGYMMIAIGLGGDVAAMFHLTTHACFKALLFLAAGSVIYALHHEQDIWKMGGLLRRLPVTSVTFLIGTLALAGVWPLSGFYSKDQILTLAFEHNRALFVVGMLTAVLTAFYMGRAVCVALLGKPRTAHDPAHPVHESPWIMLVPLIALAAASIVAGWGHRVPAFLHPHLEAEHVAPALMAAMLSAPVVGFAMAAALYGRATSDVPLQRLLGPLYRILVAKFYVDECYTFLVRYAQGSLAVLCDVFDRWVLQGLGIRGVGAGTQLGGQLVRMLQNGRVNLYAFVFGLGTVLILYLVLIAT